MKRTYCIFDTPDQRDAHKKVLIDRLKTQPGFKHSDDFVQSGSEWHFMRVIPATFPLADLAGYDKVFCPDVIAKMELIVNHLKMLSTDGDSAVNGQLEPQQPVVTEPEEPSDEAPQDETTNESNE